MGSAEKAQGVNITFLNLFAEANVLEVTDTSKYIASILVIAKLRGVFIFYLNIIDCIN